MKDDSGHTVDIASVCRRIVRTLVEKRNWTLLPEDEWVEVVLGSIQSGVSPAEVERLAKYHYSIALYQACRQTEDPARREQGYSELFCFLFRAAYNRWPDLAEDATQRALALVYEQIDCCQNPGTFLAFALYKLRHAFQQEQRARGRELPLEEIGQSGAEKDQEARDCFGRALHLDQQERLQMLLDAIQRLPKEREQKVIFLRFFGGLSDAEIGERLEIKEVHVRVLRHRGIARLRKDERLRGYFGTYKV